MAFVRHFVSISHVFLTTCPVPHISSPGVRLTCQARRDGLPCQRGAGGTIAPGGFAHAAVPAQPWDACNPVQAGQEQPRGGAQPGGGIAEGRVWARGGGDCTSKAGCRAGGAVGCDELMRIRGIRRHEIRILG